MCLIKKCVIILKQVLKIKHKKSFEEEKALILQKNFKVTPAQGLVCVNIEDVSNYIEEKVNVFRDYNNYISKQEKLNLLGEILQHLEPRIVAIHYGHRVFAVCSRSIQFAVDIGGPALNQTYSRTVFMRVCQKFKTTLYINQTRNLSESHLSCEFSLFLIFKYSEMPPKAFYKAKTDANMV